MSPKHSGKSRPSRRRRKRENERNINETVNEYYRKKDKKEKKSKNIWKKLLIVFSILALLSGTALGFLLYGPYSGFRVWLVTVSMKSMTHQWIAHMFYDNATISEIMRNNRVEEVHEQTDTNSINTSKTTIVETYKNKYDKQILGKNLDKDEYDIYADEKEYRIVKISGKGYSGFLAAVYDPSKMKAFTTSRLGVCGEYLTKMAKDNNALVAVNGGRFYDPKYRSNGANPRGVTFSNGECKTAFKYNGTGGIIGFNEDDVLVLSSTCTKNNAKALNIRDCVTAGPFLIVNGKASAVLGNGGWGSAPRTAIGQRKDGVVLLLVLDGRTLSRPGADMDDLIEIMQNYGAYNAANLDGGTSSVMAVNGELINDPIDSSGAHKTRYIATGFGLIDE